MPDATELTADGRPRKLPGFQVAVLCMVQFNEAIQGNIIWPFLPFMAMHFGAKDDEIGKYVGALASSFFLAQLMFVVLWGRAADRFGRRPTLLVGLLGTCGSMLLFGFSPSFGVAMLSRFMTGALNGNVALAKVYMGEICTQENLARGFAWISLTWGLGALIAPALGGWLADPVGSGWIDGATPAGQLLSQYPYLLPSLVSACVSVVGFVLGVLYLPETQVWRLNQASRRAAATAAAAAGSAAQRRKAAEAEFGDAEADEEQDEGWQEDAPMLGNDTSSSINRGISNSSRDSGMRSRTTSPPLRPLAVAAPGNTALVPGPLGSPQLPQVTIELPALSHRSGHPAVSADSGRNDDEGENEQEDSSSDIDWSEDEGDKGAAMSKATTPLAAKKGRSTVVTVSSNNGGSAAAATGTGVGAGAGAGGTPIEEQPPFLDPDAGFLDLLRDRAVFLTILVYCLLAFTMMIFEETLPVLLEIEQPLGLKWPVSSIGSLQVVQGVTQILFQLMIYPAVVKRMGLLRAFRWAVLPMVPLFLFFPLLSRTAQWPPAAQWVMMGVAAALKTATSTTSFTAIIMSINNSARGVALGSVNGLAQAMASLARTVGPTLGGSLFDLALSFSPLGDYRLLIPYGFMALLAAVTWVASFKLPIWIERPPMQKIAGTSGGAAPTATAATAAKASAAAETRSKRPTASKAASMAAGKSRSAATKA